MELLVSNQHAQEVLIIFNYKGESMNPVFVFLVLVGAVILWFLLSALFYPFGRFLHRIWKDAADGINREDQNKEKKD